MTLAQTLAVLHAASFTPSWSAHEFESLLANPTTHAVTSAHGFALVQIIPPEAELITLSILPEARGRGHGKALLAKALATAAQNRAPTMFLEVDATNTAAIALYKSAGFTQTGLRPGYYAHPRSAPTDAVTMTRASQKGT